MLPLLCIMKYQNFQTILGGLALASVLAFAPACGEDDEHADPDHAHLAFVNAPATTLTTSVSTDVTYQVHTEGNLHHTEIRACMGHNTSCGLGDASTFDVNFAATLSGDIYTAPVSIESAGPWTIAVFAHVGETPHISDVIHTMVSDQ